MPNENEKTSAEDGSFPEPCVHYPNASHTHTAILLHGIGSSGSEFAAEIFECSLSSGASLNMLLLSWRWVFPTAKDRWSTVFREELTEWFDIYSLSDVSAEQQRQVEGLKEGARFLLELVEDEAKRVGGNARKLVLGGISQGEATALYVLLLGRRRLGGFVGASGWCPFAREIKSVLGKAGSPVPAQEISKRVDLLLRETLGMEEIVASPSSEQLEPSTLTPVFLGHGVDDIWVGVALGKEVRDLLVNLGYSVSWNEYEGADQDGHWLKEPQELDDILAFLHEKVARPIADSTSTQFALAE